jgi:RpiB/LacA/LacB family sugar-phosphate isomerase
MRVALASDETTTLTDAIDAWLRGHGHAVVRFGALREGDDPAWTSMAREAAEAVARGEADVGIVCCWSGTGASIAANKVRGIRAALCGDAVTAQAARAWNDANVLALSLRATSVDVVKEILEAFFSAAPTDDPAYAAMIDSLRDR